jgi:hypothetical protein
MKRTRILVVFPLAILVLVAGIVAFLVFGKGASDPVVRTAHALYEATRPNPTLRSESSGLSFDSARHETGFVAQGHVMRENQQRPRTHSLTRDLRRHVENPSNIDATDGVPTANVSPQHTFADNNHVSSSSAHASDSTSKSVEMSVTVNPDAPGNSIIANAQRVTVEKTTLTDKNETALDLSITSESSLARNDAGTANSATGVDSYSHAMKVRGFTYEEELFRTKWGWAAFDQAGRAAQAAAGGSL